MKTFKLSVITQEGEIKEDSSAESPALGVPGFPALQTQAVNRFLANQRHARAKAKTRGEVVGSGAKIWRQKGTGRARHGDKQAPIFVGGGAAHGPTGTQNYKKKMNQKMIQKAILSLLSDKFKEKKLFLLENLDFKKTREAFAFLQKVKEKLSVKKEVAFVLSKKDNFGRYLNNLKGVSLLRVESLNPYLLLKTDLLFFSRGALEEIEKRTQITKKGKGTNEP